MESMVGTERRRLGHSGIEVSAMGLGCWAIGGAWTWDGTPVGWGETDDEESIRAIRAAIDLGVSFFDTADVYGCGRSERVLGKAIAGRAEEIVVATKFGNVFDEETRTWTGEDVSPAAIRQACQASLGRLGREHIDLYQLHIWSLPQARAEEVAETLEELVAAGLADLRWRDVLARPGARLFVEDVAELGCYDNVVLMLSDRLAQHPFAAAATVDVGCVEEADAKVDRCADGADRLLVVGLAPADGGTSPGPGTTDSPATEPHRADLDAGAAKPACCRSNRVLHRTPFREIRC